MEIVGLELELWKRTDIKVGAYLSAIRTFDFGRTRYPDKSDKFKEQRDNTYDALLTKYTAIPIADMDEYNISIGEVIFPTRLFEGARKSIVRLGQILGDNEKTVEEMEKIREYANWLQRHERYKLYRSATNEDERNERMAERPTNRGEYDTALMPATISDQMVA